MGSGPSRGPDHRFGEGDPFSVGLEEELLLVDADGHRLAHVADKVLPRIVLGEGRADHEAFLAEIELRSSPCTSAGEAAAELSENRAAARSAGATLMAAGLHPDARLGDVRIVDADRYLKVEREMRGLIRRTPECALHVHVGMPDPEAAVAALTGLREALPLLQGLAANSPFWYGVDSGMASARSAAVRAYPGRGVPPPLGSWEEYLDQLDAIAAGGRAAHRATRVRPGAGVVVVPRESGRPRREDPPLWPPHPTARSHPGDARRPGLDRPRPRRGRAHPPRGKRRRPPARGACSRRDAGAPALPCRRDRAIVRRPALAHIPSRRTLLTRWRRPGP